MCLKVKFNFNLFYNHWALIGPDHYFVMTINVMWFLQGCERDSSKKADWGVGLGGGLAPEAEEN